MPSLLASAMPHPRRNLGGADAGGGARSTPLARKRVALWGAGRLFDSLVLAGGFDPDQPDAADRYPSEAAHVPERHGVKLCLPEALAGRRWM